MMKFPKPEAVETVSRTVTLADGQTFDLLLKPPTLAERMNSDGLQALAYANTPDGWANLHLYRFNAVIIGWANVTEDADPPEVLPEGEPVKVEPKPVAFSQEKLRALIAACPETISQVQRIAAEPFVGFRKGSAPR